MNRLVLNRNQLKTLRLFKDISNGEVKSSLLLNNRDTSDIGHSRQSESEKNKMDS